MNCLWSLNIPLLQSNPIIINFTSGGGGRGEGGEGGGGEGGGGGSHMKESGMFVAKLELRP